MTQNVSSANGHVSLNNTTMTDIRRIFYTVYLKLSQIDTDYTGSGN